MHPGMGLVLYPGNNYGCRAPQRIQVKAQSAGNGRRPLQGLQRRIGSSGSLPAGEPESGRPRVLRLLARAEAIPGEARLAFNRFPARCIRHYYLDRVLAACVNSEAEAGVVHGSLMPQSGLVWEDTRRSIS